MDGDDDSATGFHGSLIVDAILEDWGAVAVMAYI